MRVALRLHANRCAAAVANSESTAEDASSVFGRRLKVHTVRNGVDLNRFSPSATAIDLDSACGLLPAESKTIRVGLVATLARWKGHDVFLRALSSLPADLRVRGYIIGDALYRTEGSQYDLDDLRALASSYGVADKVGFTGFLPNPAAAIRALDIVVHASTQSEPFGLVIAEAMACGRPVILSDAGGAHEILELGEGAIGHTPGDAADLALCIQQLASDQNLRIYLGSKARQTAERFFDRARFAPELLSIYGGLVSVPDRTLLEFQHTDTGACRPITG
jgi:glycosyltransferase involved in cell wall biosynthesis